MTTVVDYDYRGVGTATGTVDGLQFMFRTHKGVWELVVREATDRFAVGKLVAEAFGHCDKSTKVCLDDVLAPVWRKLTARGNKKFDESRRDWGHCPMDYPEGDSICQISDTASGISGAFQCKDDATYENLKDNTEVPLVCASPALTDASLRVEMFSEAYDEGDFDWLYHYFSLSDWREWARLNNVTVCHLVYIPDNCFVIPPQLPGIFDAEDECGPEESDLNRYRLVCTLQEKYDVDFDLKHKFDRTGVDEIKARIEMAELLKEEGFYDSQHCDCTAYRLCVSDLDLDQEQYEALCHFASDYGDSLMYERYDAPSRGCCYCGSLEQENDCCGWD
jgi:hypothetical protein